MSKSNNLDRKTEEETGSFILSLIHALVWYFLSSFKFFQKIYIGKFKGWGVKISTCILLTCIGICFYTYVSPHTLTVDKVTLGKLLLPFIYMPFAHLLVDIEEKKKEHVNDLDNSFRKHYHLFGFKEDIEKGFKYPYCIGYRTRKKEIIYVFRANQNSMDNFKKHVDILEELTNLEYKETRKNKRDKGLIEVVFHNPNYTIDRLNIEEVNINNNNNNGTAIPINNDISWKPWDDPHMLINGGTGGGKTFFIFYLIKQFLEQSASIKICDPKHSDLTRLKKFLGDKNVAYKHEEIANIMQDAVQEMFRRADEVEKFENAPLGADYRYYGFEPMYIIFDEYMAYMRGGTDDKVKKETQKAVLDVVAMGRQLGVNLIIGTQKGSTKTIDGDVRTQFHFRCVLGKMDAEGYKMAFGENYKLKKTLNGKGSGFIQIEGRESDEPEEFYTPYIDKGYDLLKEIAKLTNHKYSEIEEKRAKKEKKTISLEEIKAIKLTKEK